METRIICENCEEDEFHVLLLGYDEFVQFKCIACGAIIKADSADNPTKKFMLDHCYDPSDN